MLPQATADLYAAQSYRSSAAAVEAVSAWSQVGPGGDWDAQWRSLLPRVMARLLVFQVASAQDAAAAITPALDETGFPGQQLAAVNPRAFAGRTLNGGMLSDAVWRTVIDARVASGAPEQMLATAGARLATVVQTAMADTARLAGQAQITATKDCGYVRWEPAPYCHRCAPLVGKWFAHNKGFERHPRCDAIHRPASSREAPAWYSRTLRLDDVRDLTDAERRAISDGSDIYRVLNADRYSDRGMTGWAATNKPGSVGWIYSRGGDREQTLALLRRFGYLK